MPIETHVAGEPASIRTLAAELEVDVVAALTDTEAGVAGAHRRLEASWSGEAAQAALGQVMEVARLVHPLALGAQGVGRAVQSYADALADTQELLEQARRVALSGGLPMTGTLIEGPPVPGDPAWLRDLAPPTQPAAEVVYRAWLKQHDVYLRAEDLADRAYAGLADACRELIHELGQARGALARVRDAAAAVLPSTTVNTPASALPQLERRMRAAARRAGVVAALSPEQSQALYDNLFLQLDQLDDAHLLRRLSGVARVGGPGADLLMSVHAGMVRVDEGQPDSQVWLAEGGGFLAGTAATVGTWGATGGSAGSLLGPIGTVVAATAAAATGAVVAMTVRDRVDDWYSDRAFEQRMREQVRVQAQEQREEQREERGEEQRDDRADGQRRDDRSRGGSPRRAGGYGGEHG